MEHCVSSQADKAVCTKVQTHSITVLSRRDARRMAQSELYLHCAIESSCAGFAS